MAALVMGWLVGALIGADPPAPTTQRPSVTPPEGPRRELIRYGERLVSDTRRTGRAFAKADMNCTSCHLELGRTANAASWVGLWSVFPEYRARTGRFVSIEDRVVECFERSLNGHPPPRGSHAMQAILAYLQWLSEDVPPASGVGRGLVHVTLPEGATASAERGERIYATRCAHCHGRDGSGMQGDGFFYPPLWGPRSFTIAAGMARLSTAAAFVKANMPYGQGNTLRDLEAYDVALYFTSKPRPDFAGKTRDWPNGDRPGDARY